MRLIDADAFKKWLLENSINEREERESRQIGIWIDAFLNAEPDAPDINVGDMISRQAAIDVVHSNYDEILDFKSTGRTVADSIEDILSDLPSAEPEIAENISLCKCYITDKDGLQHKVIHTGDTKVIGWEI